MKQVNVKTISYYCIYFVVGVFVIFKGAIYYPDSFAFLKMSFNRSPVYSSFLKLFTSVFGDNFELPVTIVQYILIALSIHYFLKVFKKIFEVSFLGLTVLQLILLAPCYHWFFAANKLLSESLSYALVIFISALLTQGLIERNIKFLIKLLIPLFVLILTRGQFLALIPVVLYSVVFINFKEKQIKQSLLVLFLLLALPAIVSLSERTYNKIVHDKFINYKMSSVHAISAAFYVSDANDEAIFTSKEEKDLFKRTYTSLSEAGFLKKELKKDIFDYQELFRENFTKICNARVHQLNLDYYAVKGLDYYEQQIKVDALTSKMILPLIKNNLKSWLGFVYHNLKYTFGTSKYMVLLLIILFYSVYISFKTNKKEFVFIAFMILCMFANNAIIAIATHSVNRYTFYFDWVLFAFVILFIDPYFKKIIHVN